MKLSVFALAVTAVAGAVASNPGWSLRNEHPGRVFSKSHSQGCCVQGVVHDDDPRGYLAEYNDGELLRIYSGVEACGIELTWPAIRDAVCHIAAPSLPRPAPHGRSRGYSLLDRHLRSRDPEQQTPRRQPCFGRLLGGGAGSLPWRSRS